MLRVERKPTSTLAEQREWESNNTKANTLYINVDRDELRGRHLNDEQLCADWQHEFPDAVKFTPFHVQGFRRDYLEGSSRVYRNRFEPWSSG